MRSIASFFSCVVFVAAFFFTLSGCSLDVQEEDTMVYVAAGDLSVTPVQVPPEVEETYILDTSGSINRMRTEIYADVLARFAIRPDSARACVVQIASDSTASVTNKRCWDAPRSVVCTYPKIKPFGAYGTVREQKEYEEATLRLLGDPDDDASTGELGVCMDGLVQPDSIRTTQIEELRQYLAALTSQSNTDINGAFRAAVELSECGEGCGRELWVWSDMVPDLTAELAAAREASPLVIDFSAVPTSVHVRYVNTSSATASGEGEWASIFTSWGISSLDWKTFNPPEFATSTTPQPIVSSRTTVTPTRRVAAPASPAAASSDDGGWIRRR